MCELNEGKFDIKRRHHLVVADAVGCQAAPNPQQAGEAPTVSEGLCFPGQVGRIFHHLCNSWIEEKEERC